MLTRTMATHRLSHFKVWEGLPLVLLVLGNVANQVGQNVDRGGLLLEEEEQIHPVHWQWEATAADPEIARLDGNRVNVLLRNNRVGSPVRAIPCQEAPQVAGPQWELQGREIVGDDDEMMGFAGEGEGTVTKWDIKVYSSPMVW